MWQHLTSMKFKQQLLGRRSQLVQRRTRRQSSLSSDFFISYRPDKRTHLRAMRRMCVTPYPRTPSSGAHGHGFRHLGSRLVGYRVLTGSGALRSWHAPGWASGCVRECTRDVGQWCVTASGAVGTPWLLLRAHSKTDPTTLCSSLSLSLSPAPSLPRLQGTRKTQARGLDRRCVSRRFNQARAVAVDRLDTLINS